MSGRLFCFYGDDFTGSTDALEALAANGVPAVLFTDPPNDHLLARFNDYLAVGIAGESRSRDPEWMSGHLPPVFQNLRRLGTRICQYKVCSTFDSSPQYGSIGRALEIGQQVFGNAYVPIVVAAPHLKRYVLFGNLFAAGTGGIYRIDRHPSMRHHPLTPMDEGDLRLHLARQTDYTIALLDILALHGNNAAAALDQIAASRPDAVLFDGLDEQSLRETGGLLWTHTSAPHTFAVGSSGLTHALIQHWRWSGLIPAEPTPGDLKPADRLIVISGSCSPVTESQIHRAVKDGFCSIRIDPSAPGRALNASLQVLQAGGSAVLYTALGLRDCAGPMNGPELGSSLGVLLRDLLARSGVRRVIIAGGDTSTHSVRQLGIHALTFIAQTAPGAPLCRAHSEDADMNGLELVLKGGQIGAEDFFEKVLRGIR